MPRSDVESELFVDSDDSSDVEELVRSSSHFSAGRVVTLVTLASLLAAALLHSLPSGQSRPAVAKARGMQDRTCDDDQEYFVGICYKKCSDLHSSEQPARMSAKMCCKTNDMQRMNREGECTVDPEFAVGSKPPQIKSQEGDVADQASDAVGDVQSAVGDATNKVAGGASGLSAPSLSCDEGQEFFVGMCYKKCSDLHNGEQAARMSANMCCKSNDMQRMNREGECTYDVAFSAGGKPAQFRSQEGGMAEKDSGAFENAKEAISGATDEATDAVSDALGTADDPTN